MSVFVRLYWSSSKLSAEGSQLATSAPQSCVGICTVVPVKQVAVSDAGDPHERWEGGRQQLRQYLYVGTCKASKLSAEGGRQQQARRRAALNYWYKSTNTDAASAPQSGGVPLSCVSICTLFVHAAHERHN